jgi:peptidoglycan/LPS O-acetylase OafA/YrhL
MSIIEVSGGGQFSDVSGHLSSNRQEPMMGHRIKPLDGIRGLAILFVIAFHAFNTAMTGSPANSHPGFLSRMLSGVFGSMWAGVDLFFVLSGFLITGILMDSRSGEGYFRNFYVRRALRIFPLYYLVLITVLWVVPGVVGFRHLPAFYPHLLANQV